MTRREDPRPHVVLSTTVGDPVLKRAPYTVNLSDGGAVRVFHGNSVMIGTETDPGSNIPTAVSIAIAIFGCGCGCKEAGRAIEFVPSPEHARMFARQLTEAADEVEAAAKDAADALLARARGK